MFVYLSLTCLNEEPSDPLLTEKLPPQTPGNLVKKNKTGYELHFLMHYNVEFEVKVDKHTLSPSPRKFIEISP